jgi:hypothetical protein
MLLLVSNRHFHTASASQFNVGWDSVVGMGTLCAGQFIIQNPVGMRFFTPTQKVPGAHAVSCTMGAGSFTGASGQSVALTVHPYIVLRSKKEQICTFTPHLCLHGMLQGEL